jgi:hypothetical protein
MAASSGGCQHHLDAGRHLRVDAWDAFRGIYNQMLRPRSNPAFETIRCPGQKGNASWQSVRLGSENVRAGNDSGADTAAAPMTVSVDRPIEADDRRGRAGGDRGRSGRALVAVMKPADLGD